MPFFLSSPPQNHFMTRFLLILFSASIFFSCSDQGPKVASYSWPEQVTPPTPLKKPYKTTLHGVERVDDYYWMNDYFKKGPDSTAVVDYLKAENAYTDTMMSGTKELQTKLFNEMKARIKEKDESVPYWNNGYYYYTRFEEGKQYYISCRKKGSMDAAEEVILNVNDMAEGHPYYSASGYNVSPDNKYMVFGVDTVSRRQYVLYVKNLETGEILPERIERTGGYGTWAADSKTFFYVVNNPVTLLTEKIYQHKIGSTTPDKLVYQENDNTNYIWIDNTKSRRFLVIYSQNTLSTEVRYVDAATPDAPFKVFQPRMKEVLYSINDQGERFLVRTNHEAKNFRIVETPLNNTASTAWKDVIPHRANVLVEEFEPFRDYLVVTERKDALLHLRVQDLKNKSEHYLDFGEQAYLAYPTANYEYNADSIRYYYTSLTTPASTYDYNMATKKKTLKKMQEIVGGYDPSQYQTERFFATASDGVKVPVTIVYKKGFKKDGNGPVLMRGYGSYGYSTEPTFSRDALSLLNRGFAVALAHTRGGQEMGRQWYEDGKMMKKKNTFTDFIAVAEHLIQEKYTSKEHLYAIGGSAGGLLMGAIVNMRPDLWKGVIAAVPFVDVITTMLDETIPLTSNEWDEWGNPKNKEHYDYMMTYSPYDNVEAKAYPNLLVTTGLHDSQVQYFEPAKWVAKLREKKTDKNLLLLKTNMDFGHGGASGRFDYLKDVALNYAFVLALEGITE